MTKTAIFRVNAGPSIGAGHLVRCLALAGALREFNWTCKLVVNGEAAATLGGMISPRPDFIALTDDELYEPEGIARIAGADGCDLLVLDGYDFDVEFERACRSCASRIMVIDDLADRAHACDILLDPTLGRRPEDLKSYVEPDCSLLLGPQFAPLRPEFAQARMWARRPLLEHGPLKLLISLGATDPDNVTSTVLQGCAQSATDLRIQVLLGPAAPHIEAVKRLIQERALNAQLIVGTAAPTELMSAADLVVGTPGMAAWERCCLGVPCLQVLTASNQMDNARALVGAGAAVSVEIGRDDSPAAIAAAISDIAARPARLHQMASAAVSICGGLGARRVIMTIEPEYAQGGLRVALRPIRREDGPTILDWQHDPQTRRYFVNPDPPDTESHHVWMEKRLACRQGLTEIIECGGEPAGLLRLDRQDDGFEISILVAPARFRRGVGGGALRLARRLLPDAKLVATVHPDNAASRALFAAAGYELVEDGLHVSLPTASAEPRTMTAHSTR